MFSANSSQVSDDKLFVEDVFSTYLYTGNSGTQTITNGIDLAGKGGLIWLKSRSSTGGHPIGSHHLFDTVRGIGAIDYVLRTNLTDAQSGVATIQSVNSDGFTFGGGNPSSGNFNGETYASWTFREAPKFFDIVTYTGNGTSRNIAHNLGSVPGMIIVKRTDAGVASSFWAVYHRSLSNPDTNFLRLNTQDAQANYGGNFISGVSSTNFTVSDSGAINENGGTYVAYVFAHDATSDGIIQCGSYNGVTEVNLGWEPQWLLVKPASNTAGWYMFDNMRGLTSGGTGDNYLEAQSSAAENTTYPFNLIDLTSTGFKDVGFGYNNTIYIAIRRGPMRTPTLGTSVFAPFATSLAVDTAITTNFPVDLMISGQRNSNNATDNWAFIDRLRGATASNNTSSTPQKRIKSTSTNAEDSPTYPYAYNWWNTGLVQGYGLAGASQIYYTLRRAPGFFDEVCYSGNGVANRSIPHNLGVTPELSITKARKSLSLGDADSNNWIVRHKDYEDSVFLMNSDRSPPTWSPAYWPPTTTWFGASSLNTGSPTNGQSWVNGSGEDYVAYLFASCPGVSKVGSYTGNGSSQTINCGFAAGARFVMIKRANAAGDWYVWDTARGIVAANDPHLSLNTTAAEVTTDDSVDTASSGFVVNQDAATNVNVNAATYIYLAIA